MTKARWSHFTYTHGLLAVVYLPLSTVTQSVAEVDQ